uniref:26S proteasome non-ATPase regulatory subunit 4 n=1 Tax=Tanacetum cinerariifolium TaxID=118510 RepID=A0A699GR43_TANCI|nr:26S proteasome non-ATPase regulatory subunit 4 [Tanacetum cinerariifolium]
MLSSQTHVTVICVDNTALVTERAGVYIAQAMAIALYCDEKIKAHPDNMVALVPMGPLGRLTMDSAELQRCATQLKAFDVAIDVVDLGIQHLRPKTKFQLLKNFVSIVDNGGNSRYLYAPSGLPTPLWQQILKSPLAPGPFPKLEELKTKQREISYYFRKRH